MILYRRDGGTPTTAQVVVVSQWTPAPAYNAVSVSRDHAGLQQGGQLARPHRFTMPRAVHLSVPSQMLRSSLPSVSRGLVYINAPGRTCLHELLLSMSKSLLGKPGFSFNKLEANYHILSTAVCTGWLNGKAHKLPPLQFC